MDGPPGFRALIDSLDDSNNSAPRPRRAALKMGLIAVLMAAGAVTGIVLALSGGKAEPGAPALKEGWTNTSLPADGFSVGLPPKWKSVPTTSAEEATQALKDANPVLAKLVGDQLGGNLSSLMKLLAFDEESPTLAGDFATNMHVVVTPVPSNVGLDVFVEQNLSQLRRLPSVSGVQSQRLTLPAGEAALVHSELTVNTGKGPQTAAISQYLLVGRDRGYILSFSTLPSALTTYAPLFDEIAKTFRFV